MVWIPAPDFLTLSSPAVLEPQNDSKPRGPDSHPGPPRVAGETLAGGNFSNVKGVGSGVFEFKVDFGPGCRVYFGKDGEHLVILLGGGQEMAAALYRERDRQLAGFKRRKPETAGCVFAGVGDPLGKVLHRSYIVDRRFYNLTRTYMPVRV